MSVPMLPDPAALAAAIPDGAHVALPKGENPDPPVAVALELVRRGAKNLHVTTVPTCAWPGAGLAIDILIGAGCVASVETSGISFSELGPAPRFTAAVKAGTLKVVDSTCPAVYAAVQAGAKGQPFCTLRGLIGSDLMTHRDDWAEIDNPFAPGDRIAALKAINPDVALFHAPKADRNGNVWVGRNRDLKVLAQASDRTLVTVEDIVDADFMADPELAAGTLPDFYIEAMVHAPGAAWPMLADGGCDIDGARGYLSEAKTAEGFDAWIARALAHGLPRPMQEAAE
ncbi:CoA transferase subunit A [Rhodovulum sp. DZ06]|uniref:CoA transferase subunit A n=1 Tax=Rhodovulum sp. DZ06 TaxID=3425126 RepID=UPI003D34FAC4